MYNSFRLVERGGKRIGGRYKALLKNSLDARKKHLKKGVFSQERMTYHRETGKVEYRSKERKETKVLHAPEWLPC